MTPIPVQRENLPAGILTKPQFVVWKLEAREGGKPTKVPYNAGTGGHASTTKSTTWRTLEQAWRAYHNAPDYAGIGFVFARGGGMFGVDLDGCIDLETGEIAPWAVAIMHDEGIFTYGEISPSGTGIKLFGEGSLPGDGRRLEGIFGPGTAVEFYDQARFFTMTGRRLPELPEDVCDCSEAIQTLYRDLCRVEDADAEPEAYAAPQPVDLDDQALLDRMFASKVGDELRRLWNGDKSVYNGDDSRADWALARALAYWTGKDGPRMDRMFRRSGLMRPKWNEKRRDSTYGADTIRKAIARTRNIYTPQRTWEAGKKDGPVREKRVGAPASARAVEKPLEEAEAIDETLIPQWPGEIGEWAYYGLAGDIVRTIYPHTEADAVALLVTILAKYGNAIGRGSYYPVGAARHMGNINACLVGRSAKGRKGTAEGEIQRVFELATPSWTRDHCVSGLSSGEGLIFAVRDPIYKMERDKKSGASVEVLADPGVSDKRLFVIEPEFGSVLRVSTREGNTLSAIIRQAWDSGNLRVLNKNSPLKATGAHISIMGHVTKDELLRFLDSTDYANGFANRFLWVAVRRSKHLPDGGKVPTQMLDELAVQVAEALQHGRENGDMTRDPTARDLWHAEYPRLTRERDGMLGAVTSRAEAQVVRLSILYALLDRSVCVREEHLRAALAVWDYCEASAAWVFGAAIGNPLADAIYDAVRAAEKGLTKTEISAALGRNKTAAEISAALGCLAERGLIRQETEKREGGGRPAERWMAL